MDDPDFLRAFGERVRGERARRGMSRKTLARHAGISERYLTQLESGKANVSILLLRHIAAALGLPLSRVILTPDELKEAQVSQTQAERSEAQPNRAGRIALIGLRGAGKTTIGSAAARELEVPFIELDREIERLSGTSLGSILELYGQQAYRRYELQALQELLAAHPRFVVATGGSLVSEVFTYELLLQNCLTVWVRTTPEEHMQRVLDQGDLRPMAGSHQAMDDLRRILDERSELYSRADITIVTTGRSAEDSVRELLESVRNYNSGSIL